jgi:hypothetical protein
MNATIKVATTQRLIRRKTVYEREGEFQGA